MDSPAELRKDLLKRVRESIQKAGHDDTPDDEGNSPADAVWELVQSELNLIGLDAALEAWANEPLAGKVGLRLKCVGEFPVAHKVQLIDLASGVDLMKSGCVRSVHVNIESGELNRATVELEGIELDLQAVDELDVLLNQVDGTAQKLDPTDRDLAELIENTRRAAHRRGPLAVITVDELDRMTHFLDILRRRSRRCPRCMAKVIFQPGEARDAGVQCRACGHSWRTNH